jgi:MoxR-like ATPase
MTQTNRGKMERTTRKAQVDRFMQRLVIDYPKMEDEPEWSFTGKSRLHGVNRGFLLEQVLRQHEAVPVKR